LNYSRGDVVDLDALKKQSKRGAISGGAALTFFPDEPGEAAAIRAGSAKICRA